MNAVASGKLHAASEERAARMALACGVKLAAWSDHP